MFDETVFLSITRSIRGGAQAALLLLAVLAMGSPKLAGAANSFPDISSYYQQAQHVWHTAPTGFTPMEAVETELLNLTNAERAAAGLRQVRIDSGFAETARYYATDMLTRRFFDHQDPEGRGPMDRLTSVHRSFIGSVGENLFRGAGVMSLPPRAMAQLIMDQLKASPSHRANIMNPDWQVLGVGIVKSGEEIRAVQLFGEPLAYLHQEMPLMWAASTPIPADILAVESGRLTSISFMGGRRPLSEISVKEFMPLDQIMSPYRPGAYQVVALLRDSQGAVKMAFGPKLDILNSLTGTSTPRLMR